MVYIFQSLTFFLCASGLHVSKGRMSFTQVSTSLYICTDYFTVQTLRQSYKHPHFPYSLWELQSRSHDPLLVDLQFNTLRL